MKKKLFILTLFLLLFSCLSLYAQAEKALFIYADRVVDLRGGNFQTQQRGFSGPGGYATMEDLEVGSIFITADGNARKVTAIYDSGGDVVVETAKPTLEEVYVELYVPDTNTVLTPENSNIGYISRGVTINNDYTPSSRSGDRHVDWLDTDTDYTEDDIYTHLNLDITISSDIASMLGKVKELAEKQLDSGDKDKKKDSGDDKKKTDDDKKKTDSGTDKKKTDSGTDSKKSDSDHESDMNKKKKAADKMADGGDDDSKKKKGLDIDVGAEFNLKGTLSIARPEMDYGIKMPSVKVTWVKVWWIVGYPKFEFENGYIHALAKFAQQLDVDVNVTASISKDFKIPIIAIVLKDPWTGQLGLNLGIFLKLDLSGQITVGAEISEYTKTEVWGTADLFWPFIPIGFHSGSDLYYNFSFHPYVEVQGEVKAGPALVAGIDISGIDVLEASAFGGVYVTATGRLEPLGCVGYAGGTSAAYTGPTGGFDGVILEGSVEAGAFFDVGLDIFTIGIPIFEKKWPLFLWKATLEL